MKLDEPQYRGQEAQAERKDDDEDDNESPYSGRDMSQYNEFVSLFKAYQ